MSFSNLRRGDSVFIDANIFIYSFGGLSNPQCIRQLSKLELTHSVIEKSAVVRQKEGLLTNDSLVIAFMRDFNLTKLATNDGDFDHIEDIKVFKPLDV